MRILIYEPLADMVKAPFFSNLGSQLASEGHDVIIACEQRVIYTLQGRLTEQGVINCTSTICAHIASNKSVRYTCFMPSKKLYKKVTRLNLAEKLNNIAKQRVKFYTQLFNEFEPELIYIWNGQAEHQQDFVVLAKNLGFRFNYLELGWFPQKNHYYIDPCGVNARSSMAKSMYTALAPNKKRELHQWLEGYRVPNRNTTEIKNTILVPLQVDSDSNISNHSPFKTMREFVSYLENNIPMRYQVVLRPHPKADYSYQFEIQKQNFSVDNTTPLVQLIAKSEFVVGINSTVLLESLVYNKKVVPLGHGILKKMSLKVSRGVISEWIARGQVEGLLYELVFNKQMPFQLNIIQASTIQQNKRIQLSKFNSLFIKVCRVGRAMISFFQKQ
ncbi:capsular polysaccharide export protein, LipB/KpsS family [Thalassotalea fusca]